MFTEPLEISNLITLSVGDHRGIGQELCPEWKFLRISRLTVPGIGESCFWIVLVMLIVFLVF